MRWTPFYFVCLIFIFTVMITGCGINPKPAENAQQIKIPNKNLVQAIHKTSLQQVKIKLYFADANLDGLIEKDETISYENDTNKYKAALEALKKDPSDSLFSLWEKVIFKTVSFQDGSLVINIHLPEEAHLGSDGEEFALEALQKTMFQFTEVQSIDLLVDGKSEESLMGHVELNHPMKRTSDSSGK